MLHLYYASVFCLMVGTMAFCIVTLSRELHFAFSVSPIHIRRVGGIYFWRVGRLGGSIYLAKGY